MATKKAGGVSKNGRDSNSKSLGLKVPFYTNVKKDSIIVLGKKSDVFPGLGCDYSKTYNIVCSANRGILYSYKYKKLTKNKKFFLII